MNKTTKMLLGAAAALPIAVGVALSTPAQAACNPCRATVKKANPCNPCAAKKRKAYNPCAAKKNPCRAR